MTHRSAASTVTLAVLALMAPKGSAVQQRPILPSGTPLHLSFAQQAPDQASPDEGALTVVSRDGRRPLPIARINGQEMVALADLAALFQLVVREDRLAEGLVVTYKTQTIVLSATQGLASAGGRVISLPGPPVRRNNRWLVPVDFIGRALAPIYDTRIEVRRPARLVLVGEVRVPRLNVAAESAGGQTRLIIDVVPPATHTISSERERLVLKFDADMLETTLPSRLPAEFVTGISVVPGTATLTVDLGPRFGGLRTSTLANDRSSRVILDLLPAATDATTSPPTPEAVRPPPFLLTPLSALRTVVIDPGHGGEEHGARGPNGTLEKHVTLSVGRRLKSAIENRLGLRVLLTRDEDEDVRLDERAAIANNNKADLFISLHVNASVQPSASGAEVFYLSIDEYGDEVRRLAVAEGQELPVVGGGTRPIEIILWDMAQVRHLEQSARLAQITAAQLRERLAMSPRAILEAPFRVLVGANMPAVLVEMGFISNPEEERQLASESFQQTLVQALVEAIVQFRDELQAQPERARTLGVASQSEAR